MILFVLRQFFSNIRNYSKELELTTIVRCVSIACFSHATRLATKAGDSHRLRRRPYRWNRRTSPLLCWWSCHSSRKGNHQCSYDRTERTPSQCPSSPSIAGSTTHRQQATLTTHEHASLLAVSHLLDDVLKLIELPLASSRRGITVYNEDLHYSKTNREKWESKEKPNELRWFSFAHSCSFAPDLPTDHPPSTKAHSLTKGWRRQEVPLKMNMAIEFTNRLSVGCFHLILSLLV